MMLSLWARAISISWRLIKSAMCLAKFFQILKPNTSQGCIKPVAPVRSGKKNCVKRIWERILCIKWKKFERFGEVDSRGGAPYFLANEFGGLLIQYKQISTVITYYRNSFVLWTKSLVLLKTFFVIQTILLIYYDGLDLIVVYQRFVSKEVRIGRGILFAHGKKSFRWVSEIFAGPANFDRCYCGDWRLK